MFLKREAEKGKMSIADYITLSVSRIQSIDALISSDSNVNIGGDTFGILKTLETGLNCNTNMLRRGFEPRSWAREARMLGRTTPAEQNLFYYSSSLNFCARNVSHTSSGSPRNTSLPSSINIASCVSSRITSS
jgi:hypothetical protein